MWNIKGDVLKNVYAAFFLKIKADGDIVSEDANDTK